MHLNEGNEFSIYEKTVQPASDIPARRFVGWDDELLSSSSNPAQGVSLTKISAGTLGAISAFGSVLVETGGAFDKGDPITTDATGRAVEGDETNMIGLAEGASIGAGQFVPVFLLPVRLSPGLAAGGTVTGAHTYTVDSLVGAVALRLGGSATEGFEIKVLEESIVIGGAAASFDLDSNFTGVILAVQANLETAVTATTAVKVGIGIAGDEDKYGKTGALTKNQKIDTIPDWAIVSNEDVKVFACDTAGDDAGTLDTGTIRVRIVWAQLNSLDDAA